MESKRNKFGNWLRNSITARMLVVGFLLVVLLIPLQFVQTLINERAMRQAEVVQEINQKWGNEVLLSGPILKIPYNTYKEERVFIEKTKTYQTTIETVVKTAYLLPDKLLIYAEANSKKKPLKRGMYESVVYTAAMTISGNFPPIDFSERNIKTDDILWDKISVLIKTSNLKGIKNTMAVTIGTDVLEMAPIFSQEYLNTLESGALSETDLKSERSIPFNFEMKVNGSERLQYIPIGKETKVTMTSNWPSPSFNGEYLPMDGSREISENGFKAQWEVYQINRQFEQVFFGNLPDLSRFAFGATLIIPVDEYSKSQRTAKYGFMVIGLTLLVFLLIQLVSKLYIHPFQYVMIGLALVMFYTLLISISEHSSFLKAYLIAAASVLGLITIYSRAILKGFKFPLLICTSLASLYGFIYVIIQLENYALLVGSIGLFVILALIMFASRKIDWGNES